MQRCEHANMRICEHAKMRTCEHANMRTCDANMRRCAANVLAPYIMCAPYIKHMCATARRPAGGKTVFHRLLLVVVWFGLVWCCHVREPNTSLRAVTKCSSTFSKTK